jgi:regulator of protease activity HflC (stomatin/prohibitin superfamily)
MKAASSQRPPAQPGSKFRRLTERRRLSIVMGLMVLALVGAVLYPHVIVTVPPGHAGVLWKRLPGFGIYCLCMVPSGTILEPKELREEGLHIIWPWDDLFLYDLRLQTMTYPYNAISNDGVSLTATISVRFQLQHDSVAQVHKFIGAAYPQTLVGPTIGSRARDVISQYSAEALYSSGRDEIQKKIQKQAEETLKTQLNELVQPETAVEQLRPDTKDTKNTRANGKAPDPGLKKLIPQYQPLAKQPASLAGAVELLDTLVLGIELPPAIVASINRKVEQLYIAQEYEYRVQRETLESQRKRVEAAGIRDFQQIVSQGISDSYLRWRGIEATLQLAQSNNSKTVIIGSGKDGMPIILGNVDSPAPQQAPAADGTPGRTVPPAVPLEKLPAPGLPTPGERPPDAAPAPIPPKQSSLPGSNP